MSKKIATFPNIIHARVETDSGQDYLVAAVNAFDAIGFENDAKLGVYKLVEVLDATRILSTKKARTRKTA